MFVNIILFILNLKLIGCSDSDEVSNELVFSNAIITGGNNIISMENTIHVEFTKYSVDGKTSTKFRDRKIIITGLNKPKMGENNLADFITVAISGNDAESIFDKPSGNDSGKAKLELMPDNEKVQLIFYTDGVKKDYSFKFTVTNSDQIKNYPESIIIKDPISPNSNYEIASNGVGLDLVDSGFMKAEISSDNQTPGKIARITLKIQMNKKINYNEIIELSDFHYLESVENLNLVVKNETLNTVLEKSEIEMDIKNQIFGKKIQFKINKDIDKQETLSFSFNIKNALNPEVLVMVQLNRNIHIALVDGISYIKRRVSYETNNMYVNF